MNEAIDPRSPFACTGERVVEMILIERLGRSPRTRAVRAAKIIIDFSIIRVVAAILRTRSSGKADISAGAD